MPLIIAFFCLAAFLTGVQAQPAQVPTGRVTQCTNGRWFDGQRFVPGEFFAVDGVLTAIKPAHVDTVLDFRGKYIVPPYGEAHNHNIDGFKMVEDRITKYLADGIYYVKNPNSILQRTSGLQGKINIPTSVDVVFSNGGLTATDGHPLELVRRNIGLGILTEKDADGGMYYIIDDEQDLARKWPAIIADRPDFIKTYLLYSEEFSERKDDTSYFGWKGLDPLLLPKIVRRAHLDGLRVSTHVETAADFHNALAAGVDEINHLPGFRADSTIPFSRYEIGEDDAAKAAAREVTVVTTLSGGVGSGSPAYEDKLRRLHRHNLAILKKHGVRIAIGSDSYRQTSVPEALYLSQLGAFDNAELLRIWCVNTAATIFPHRTIGLLREGYEASFLVLSDDPLKDFSNTQKIELRFKQGTLLQIQR